MFSFIIILIVIIFLLIRFKNYQERGKKIQFSNKISFDDFMDQARPGDILIFYSITPYFILPVFSNLVFSHMSVIIDKDKLCDTSFGKTTEILSIRDKVENYKGSVFFLKRKDIMKYKKLTLPVEKNKYPNIFESFMDFVLDRQIKDTENCIEQSYTVLTGQKYGIRTSAKLVKKMLKYFYETPKRILA